MEGISMTESTRLAALLALIILDTAPEKEFDDLVRLASVICGTPMSLVSLVDEHRTWSKAMVGTAVRETHRNLSFCTHAIQQPEMFIVEDATQDVRFAENAHVMGNPGVRFYAGVPLLAADGAPIGALCVVDTVPRRLDENQRDALLILAAQVQARLELRQQRKALEQANADLQTLAARLQDANRQLEEQATIDFLTRLNTRLVFAARAAVEFDDWKRHRVPLSILIMDVDNFKHRNDSYGHAAGDEALRLVGRVLQGAIRTGDVAARLGGEEFGVILPSTDLQGARNFAERFQRLLREQDAGPAALTVSIGVASADAGVPSWEMLLSHADEAMYAAKKTGKNKAIAYADQLMAVCAA